MAGPPLVIPDAPDDLAGRLDQILAEWAIHLLVVAHDEALYASLGGRPDSSAFAESAFRSSAAYPARPEHRQAVVNTKLLFEYPGTVTFEEATGIRPAQVFAHELAHLALSRFDRPATPRWVSEGGAMVLSEERRLLEWPEMVEAGVLETSP